MPTPSSPAAESDFKRAWSTLVAALKEGEAVVGERLYVLGAGPVPVEGAAGGALTLDARGGVVLVVGLGEPSASASAQIARQLEAISGLPGSKLREAGVDPDARGGLPSRHAAYFNLGKPTDLNTGQRCLVVLGAEPSKTDRAAVAAGLGGALGGIFLAAESGVTPLVEPPEEEIVLEPEAPAEEAAPEAEIEPEDAAPETEAPAEPEALAGEAEASVEPDAPAEEAEEAEAEVPAEAPVDEAPEDEDEALDLDVPGAEAPEPEGPAAIEVALDDAEPAAGDTAVTETVPPAEAEDEPAPDLVAPYLDDESTTVITEEEGEAAAAERTGVSAWPIGNWIGLTMIVVGVGLAIIGVRSWGSAGDTPPVEPKTNAEIRTVVSDVTPDATHARWIGQQRVATLADGTLVFVYPTETSLNFVKDGATSGAEWDDPFVLEDVVGAESLSVDVDSKDRLHVAYSDGASINYVRLKNKPAGWKPSRIIQIDDDTTSLHVDLAWDEQNQTAHIVWVQQTNEGEAPAWAALTNEGGIDLTEEGILAQPGTEVPVLVNVAADGRSSLLITYRRGDQTAGWSSRYSPGRSTDGRWLFNEEEQVATSAFVGAVDVLYDRQKTAHLVLRDDDAHDLLYFRKTAGEPWTDAEVAYSGDDVADGDFPTLSYNTAEANLYLFFQSEKYAAVGEVMYVVLTADGTGWQGPFEIQLEGDAIEGALYPVAPDRTSVQTIAFWTTTGETYQIDSAPVVGPTATPDE